MTTYNSNWTGTDVFTMPAPIEADYVASGGEITATGYIEITGTLAETATRYYRDANGGLHQEVQSVPFQPDMNRDTTAQDLNAALRELQQNVASNGYTIGIKKKKVLKKGLMMDKKPKVPEPVMIDGLKVFHLNRNLLDNVSASSRYIDKALMPRLSKGQGVHIRIRRDATAVKKEKLYIFFKELVDACDASGAKLGVSSTYANIPLDALKIFFGDKIKYHYAKPTDGGYSAKLKFT